MRAFYRHCLDRWEDYERRELKLRLEREKKGGVAARRDDLEESPQPPLQQGTEEPASSEPAGMETAVPYEELPALGHERCRRPVTVTAINVGSQQGLCGLRILQQFRYSVSSRISVTCHYENDLEQQQQQQKFEQNVKLDGWSFDLAALHSYRPPSYCELKAENVRRFNIDFGPDTSFYNIRDIRVNGVPINTSLALPQRQPSHARTQPPSLQSSLAVCLDDATRVPFMCTAAMHPLLERSPLTSGPVRQLYARPFHIVYGTPNEQALRLAMRDLAVYIGNAHFAAHFTQVRFFASRNIPLH